MQIVSKSIGGNLHEMSDHVSRKNKKNIISLPSAKLAQRVVMVNAKKKIKDLDLLATSAVRPESTQYALTITILWANSADVKLIFYK